jgi:limonene-1,2-epoxide hydrolase
MPSSNIEVVESFIDALKALDTERSSALMTDDIVYQNVPLPPDHGREATLRTLKGFTAMINYFDVEMHHIAERDGFVLTERTDILRGRFVDLRFWVCGTFQVRDGKIALWRDRFDIATVLKELALSPVRKLFAPRL